MARFTFVCAAALVLMALGASAQRRAVEWGEKVGGVSVRAYGAQKAWSADEPPEITIDMNNASGITLTMRRFPYCEVEVDGVWYSPIIKGLVAGGFAAHPGVHDRIAVLRLDAKRWVAKDDKSARERGAVLDADPAKRLRLERGRHTIRVACEVGARRAVSNRLEIEILPE